jgi:hypothetical protein
MSHGPDVARLQRISLELLDRPAPLRGFLHNRHHSKGTALQPAGHSFFALGDHKVDLLESSFYCLPVNALEESSEAPRAPARGICGEAKRNSAEATRRLKAVPR